MFHSVRVEGLLVHALTFRIHAFYIVGVLVTLLDWQSGEYSGAIVDPVVSF